MAQSTPRFCPHCGIKTISHQKFCPQCGWDMTDEAPVQQSPQSAIQSSHSSLEPGLSPPSDPGLDAGSKPPSRTVPKRPSTQATPPSLEPLPNRVSRPVLEPLKEVIHPSSEPSLTQVSQPPSGPLSRQTMAPSPDEAIEFMPTQGLPQPQVQGLPLSPKQQTHIQSASQFPSILLVARRLDIKRVGIWLGLVVVLGGVVFGFLELLLAFRAPSQPTITSTTLGTTVDYAGVDITVVNAQKSQSFLDDPNSTSDGMLRLQLHAQNKTSLTINLPYDTITHVTLPDGKVLSPTYVKSNVHMAPLAAGSDIVDFAVPQNVRVDQVIFHLGSVDEAQLDIPLNGHANVDQYASKTVHPNQPLAYYGLNWSITDASLQFHIDGHQASKGMRYLIMTLKVDNPLSQTVIPGSPYNYVQLKANTASIKLIDTTLPVSFDAGASGKSGTVMFLVPQDNTAFVLTLSNPRIDGFDASKPVAFQF